MLNLDGMNDPCKNHLNSFSFAGTSVKAWMR